MIGKSAQKATGKTVQFGRLPLNVIGDSRLSFAAKVCYAALASTVYQGNVARKGQRMLAQMMKAHQGTVAQSLQQLEGCGHIKIRSGARGQRSAYELLSPIFGQKIRDGERVLVKDPKSQHVRNIGGTGLVSEPRKKTA